jgi:hypothetical protein
MICPKCGFEQPDGVECMRCGVIISRYKGPVAGAGARATPPPFSPGATPPPLPPSFIPPPPVIAGGAVHAPIPPPPVVSPGGTVLGDAPANPAGGTVYGGPPPPPAGSGTVYGSPASIAPTFSSVGSGFYARFETGNVLSEAFSTYFSNFLSFVFLTALVSLPLVALAAFVSSLKSNPLLAAILFMTTLLLQGILGQVAAGGITYGVYQQMRGKDISVIECLRVGLSRLFPVLGVAIVTGVAVFVGTILCCVPGFIVASMLAVVVPVTVEEQPGLFDALRRSSYLTENFRWQTFGVLFIVGIIQQIPAQIVMRTVKDLGSLLMITIFMSVLTTGLQATASAVMYYRLRSVKEAIDVDQISSVFA